MAILKILDTSLALQVSWSMLWKMLLRLKSIFNRKMHYKVVGDIPEVDKIEIRSLNKFQRSFVKGRDQAVSLTGFNEQLLNRRVPASLRETEI